MINLDEHSRQLHGLMERIIEENRKNEKSDLQSSVDHLLQNYSREMSSQETSLEEISKKHVIVDDYPMIYALGQNVDLFKLYSELQEDPIDIQEICLTASCAGGLLQAVTFIFGVPKKKWRNFKEWLQAFTFTLSDRNYQPYFLRSYTIDPVTQSETDTVSISLIDLTNKTIFAPKNDTEITDEFIVRIEDTYEWQDIDSLQDDEPCICGSENSYRHCCKSIHQSNL